jgi:hypothetical protein
MTAGFTLTATPDSSGSAGLTAGVAPFGGDVTVPLTGTTVKRTQD